VETDHRGYCFLAIKGTPGHFKQPGGGFILKYGLVYNRYGNNDRPCNGVLPEESRQYLLVYIQRKKLVKGCLNAKDCVQ